MGEEIELKLSVAAAAVPGLLASASVKSRGIRFGRARRMVTSYYDTAKGALKKKGVFLRLREAGGRIEQTVKTAGEGGVLARRGEWNWAVKTPEPDLDLAVTSGVKALARRVKKGGLVLRFASHIERRIALYEHQGTVLELALDVGEVRAGRRTVPVSELEIEVKRGGPEALFALARELVTLPGVTVGFATKASRGFQLAEGRAAEAEKAGTADLDADMPLHLAAAAILNSAAAHAAANLGLIVSSGVPESIHQGRVALRRLRAALVLLKEALPADRRHHLRREAGWLAGALGTARDLDVLSLGALSACQPPEDIAAGFAGLKRRVAAERRTARAAARTVAASPRAQLLLLDLDETAGALAPVAEAPELKALAAKALQKRYEKVLNAGEGIETMDVEARHQLRLALKKLRYAADFFSSLFPQKAVKREVKALARLQDALGAFNDAAVAPILLQRALAAGKGRADPAVTTAATFLTGWAAYESDLAWRTAAAEWRGFTGAKPFWTESL